MKSHHSREALHVHPQSPSWKALLALMMSPRSFFLTSNNAFSLRSPPWSVLMPSSHGDKGKRPVGGAIPLSQPCEVSAVISLCCYSYYDHYYGCHYCHMNMLRQVWQMRCFPRTREETPNFSHFSQDQAMCGDSQLWFLSPHRGASTCPRRTACSVRTGGTGDCASCSSTPTAGSAPTS